jgi:hypothetical protein
VSKRGVVGLWNWGVFGFGEFFLMHKERQVAIGFWGMKIADICWSHDLWVFCKFGVLVSPRKCIAFCLGNDDLFV